jgi:tetratricopeptide (TPR) repeat protein
LPARTLLPDSELSWATFWASLDSDDHEQRARTSIIAGKLLKQCNDVEGAEVALKRATASPFAGVAGDGWNQLGLLYRRLNQPEPATAAFKQAIDSGPQQVVEKATYNLGLLVWDRRDPAAEGLFRQGTTATDPDVRAWANLLLGDVLCETMEVEAEIAYRAAAECHHPGASPQALIGLAMLQLPERRQDALTYLDQAAAYMDPSTEQDALIRSAQLLPADEVRGAIERLERARRGQRADMSALASYLFAMIVLPRGETGLAREALGQAAQDGDADIILAANTQLALMDAAVGRLRDAVLRLSGSQHLPGLWSPTDQLLGWLLFYGHDAATTQCFEELVRSTEPAIRAAGLRAIADTKRAGGDTLGAVKAYADAEEVRAGSQSTLASISLASLYRTTASRPEDASGIVERLTASDELSSFEKLILRHQHDLAESAEVLEDLSHQRGYTLGAPPEVPSAGEPGSDILHFAIGANDAEQVYLPAFTRPEYLQDALYRNPAWFNLAVLDMQLGDLLDAIDSDVRLVINPWSDLEYQPLNDATEASSTLPVGEQAR